MYRFVELEVILLVVVWWFVAQIKALG